MSEFVYQFFDVSVSINSNVQGLVQSVSVKADSGLDFVTLPTTGTQLVYNKARNIQLDIEILHNGTFVNPTGCLLYDSLGDIVIGREGNNGITFEDCILIGTQSDIQANNTFGTKTLTYMALGYSVAGDLTEPSTTSGKTRAERQCYTNPLEEFQTGFSSSCRINREFLYSPGRASPTHLCIKYPITTTSTVTKAENSESDLKTLEKIATCPEALSFDTDAGIPQAYLESVSVEGGTTQRDVQQVSYNYTSTADYGLIRIIELS